jgi:hypothetical protein
MPNFHNSSPAYREDAGSYYREDFFRMIQKYKMPRIYMNIEKEKVKRKTSLHKRWSSSDIAD